MIQALPTIVTAPTHCRQTGRERDRERERRERVARSLWRTHDNFGLFRIRDVLQRRLASIIVYMLSIRAKKIPASLFTSSTIQCTFFYAVCAFDAIVRENLIHIYLYVLKIIYVCMYIVGINRAKRAALLLHVSSQFLYLDNQWWAHLRQCSTALLDEKVRT